jgi:hypothetical protein
LHQKIKNLGPAVNVVKVLDAFEEENWPERIDDPLDPGKLAESIRSLNVNLTAIQFVRDGTGGGIYWVRR